MPKIQKILIIVMIFVGNQLKLSVFASSDGSGHSSGSGCKQGCGGGHGSWLPGIKGGKLISSIPVAMLGLTNLALMLKLGSISKHGIHARVLPGSTLDKDRKVIVYLKNDKIPDIYNLSGIIEDDKRIDKNLNPNPYVNGVGVYSSGMGQPNYNNEQGNGLDYNINSIEDRMSVSNPIMAQNKENWPKTAESKAIGVWSEPDDSSKLSISSRLQDRVNQQIKSVLKIFRPTSDTITVISPGSDGMSTPKITKIGWPGFNKIRFENELNEYQPNYYETTDQLDYNHHNKLNLDNKYHTIPVFYKDQLDQYNQNLNPIDKKSDSN